MQAPTMQLETGVRRGAMAGGCTLHAAMPPPEHAHVKKTVRPTQRPPQRRRLREGTSPPAQHLVENEHLTALDS